MNILKRLWKLLPDKCEGKLCDRKGVRGNENRVGDKLYCDGCSLPEERLSINNLSDRELNIKLITELGWVRQLLGRKDDGIVYIRYKEDEETPYSFDFNNWNDLMPLIDFGYEMKKTDSGKFHCSVLPDFYLGDITIGTRMSTETKQQALAECLLKVLESKNE